MRKSEPVSEDFLEYEIHQRQQLLIRLNTELQDLLLRADTPPSQTLATLEEKIETAQQRLTAEEQEGDSLRHVVLRTRAASDVIKMKVAELGREKQTLDDALTGVNQSTFLIDQAKALQSVKLGYMSQGLEQDRMVKLMCVSTRFADVREQSAKISEFVTRQAQLQLGRYNFLERTKHWRVRINNYELKHSELAPQSAVMRLEARTLRDKIRRIFGIFQENSAEACIEKYIKTVHSTQRLSGNINQLLIQQAETHAIKSSLKSNLTQIRSMHASLRSYPKAQKNTARVPDKNLTALQLLAFDISSMSKGILGKVDRFDTYKALGPILGELAYSDTGQTEHCVAVFLVLEKKVKMSQECVQQRKAYRKMGFRFSPSPSKPPPSLASLRKTPAALSVSAIKRHLYVSHFVQNSPLGRVDAMLGEVAQMHVNIKSSFKQVAPYFSPSSSIHLAPADREVEEENYLRLAKRAQKKHLPDSDTVSMEELEKRTRDLRGIERRHKSDLELITGIPQISQSINDLSKFSQILHREAGQNVKELYEALSWKRNRLLRLSKGREPKRNESESVRLPGLRSNSGSPVHHFAEPFRIAPKRNCAL